VIKNVPLSDFCKQKISETVKELEEEYFIYFQKWLDFNTNQSKYSEKIESFNGLFDQNKYPDISITLLFQYYF